MYNWTSEFLILDNQIITRWCDGILVSCMRYKYQWYINSEKLFQANEKIKRKLIALQKYYRLTLDRAAQNYSV